jgi:hypothetical protein
MAMQRPNSIVKEHIVTVFKDAEGNPIQQTEYGEEIAEFPDGTTVTEKRAENFALASGELYNPSLSSPNNPIMLVGLCAMCGSTSSVFPWRRKPTTRLCNVEHLKECSNCGRVVCSAHRRKGEDRKWRCIPCHRKHWWASLLSPLFLREPEE